MDPQVYSNCFFSLFYFFLPLKRISSARSFRTTISRENDRRTNGPVQGCNCAYVGGESWLSSCESMGCFKRLLATMTQNHKSLNFYSALLNSVLLVLLNRLYSTQYSIPSTPHKKRAKTSVLNVLMYLCITSYWFCSSADMGVLPVGGPACVATQAVVCAQTRLNSNESTLGKFFEFFLLNLGTWF